MIGEQIKKMGRKSKNDEVKDGEKDTLKISSKAMKKIERFLDHEGKELQISAHGSAHGMDSHSKQLDQNHDDH